MYFQWNTPLRAFFEHVIPRNSVVAQLRSLPIPEIRGSNPVIGEYYLLSNCIEKTKINKKEAVNCPFF